MIDPIAHTLRSDAIWGEASEFPVLDPRFEGGAAHALFILCADEERHAIARLDLKTRRARVVTLGENEKGSEPIFVPRNETAPECDGWVLSLVYDGERDTSHLAIFDTARFEDGPVARCHFETHVPMTFHGVWLPRAR